MQNEPVITDLGNNWRMITRVFEADVIVLPKRWQFWKKPRRERRTFTSCVVARFSDGEGYLADISVRTEGEVK